MVTNFSNENNQKIGDIKYINTLSFEETQIKPIFITYDDFLSFFFIE